MFSLIASWVGAVLVLLAFALNIRKVVTADSTLYILLNLIGSTLLGVSAFITRSYAFVAINVVWVLFAMYSYLVKFQNNSEKG